MRVCVLIDAWKPVWGGGQTHVLELSRHLAKDFGVKVDIFTRYLITSNKSQEYPAQEELFPGVNLFRCGPRTSFSNLFGRLTWLVLVINQVRRKHGQAPYNLIHAHAYISGIPAKVLGSLLKLPVMYTVHGALNMDQQKFNLTTFLEWLLLTRLRYTRQISVTHNFLKYPNVNRSTYIPNGTQVNVKNAKRKTDAHGIKQMLWIGRMEEQKGLDVLLRALHIVNQREHKWSLCLIGDGSQRVFLEKLSDKLQIRKKIKFLGAMTPSSISKFYQEAQIFVLPSRAEGLSLVLLEALAYGLPVIATDVGDNNLLIQHGINGLLVKSDDTFDLAIKIEEMFDKHASLSFNSSNKAAEIKRKYNWEMIAKATYTIYQKYA